MSPCATESILALNSIGVEIGKCQEKKRTRQFALNAEKNVKFRSSLTEVDPSTAENVTLNVDLQGDIKLTG